MDLSQPIIHDTDTLRRIRRDLHAEHRTRDAAVLDDLVDDSFHSINWQREADAGEGARRAAVNRGVDADEAAAAIKQRPARVACAPRSEARCCRLL